jgi:hypothetical protein
MKESFDQQAAHNALSSTGSRQAGHKGGRPKSSTRRPAARITPARRMKRLDRGSLVTSASMEEGYRSR